MIFGLACLVGSWMCATRWLDVKRPDLERQRWSYAAWLLAGVSLGLALAALL